jgi:hypothetical protein
MPKVGDHVVFVDPVGQEHNAIVIANWGQGDTPSLNVMFADPDESKTDSYGRQIARNTSVVHQSNQAAHGMYWREP